MRPMVSAVNERRCVGPGRAVLGMVAVTTLLTSCGSTARIDDPSPVARIEILEAGASERTLARAARHDPSRHVRRAAVERTLDQALLWEIASSDPDGSVRRRAIARITDPDRLADLATHAEWWKDRQAAVAGPLDRTVLRQIAVRDPDPGVRRDALARLQSGDLERLVAGGDGPARIVTARRQKRVSRLSERSTPPIRWSSSWPGTTIPGFGRPRWL